MYNFSLPPHYVHQLGAEYYAPSYTNTDYEDYRWNWWNWWSAQMFSLPPDPRSTKQLMEGSERVDFTQGVEKYLTADRVFYPTASAKPEIQKPVPTIAKRETP